MSTTIPLTNAEFRGMLVAQIPRLRRRLSFLLRERVRRRSPDFADDLLQEALLALLRAGPESLAWWQAEYGPVEQGVLLLAERAARSYLRSGRRSGWAEIPTQDHDLHLGVSADFEGQVLARRELQRVASELELRFGERASGVLAAWLQGQPAERACDALQLTPNALYCLKRRLKLAVAKKGRSTC